MSAKAKNRKWTRTLVEVLIIIAVVVAFRAYMQRDAIEGQAPQIAGQLLDGQTVSLAQYRGAPVLVHFWASWCGICRFTESGIDSLAADYPVLTIAMQSGDEETLRRYMQEQGLSFAVLADEDGSIARQFGVAAVPASFILDGEGQVRFVEFGYSSGLGLRARLWLAGWL